MQRPFKNHLIVRMILSDWPWFPLSIWNRYIGKFDSFKATIYENIDRKQPFIGSRSQEGSSRTYRKNNEEMVIPKIKTILSNSKRTSIGTGSTKDRCIRTERILVRCIKPRSLEVFVQLTYIVRQSSICKILRQSHQQQRSRQTPTLNPSKNWTYYRYWKNLEENFDVVKGMAQWHFIPSHPDFEKKTTKYHCTTRHLVMLLSCRTLTNDEDLFNKESSGLIINGWSPSGR